MKWGQDHEEITFLYFKSCRSYCKLRQGKEEHAVREAKGPTICQAAWQSGVTGNSEGTHRDTAGPQGGCRNLVCYSDNASSFPSRLAQLWSPSSVPVSARPNNSQTIPSTLWSFTLPSISRFAILHTCFVTESNLDSINICLLCFSNARPDIRAVTNSQLIHVSL